MRQLVAELLTRSLEEAPPFDLDALARLAGAQAVEVCELDIDGDLYERDGHLVVRASRAAPLGRRRFTIAHEISHLLLMPILGVATRAKHCGEDRELERLCDVAATELLMPADHVRSFFERTPLGVESVVSLARDFEVSLHAAGLRVVELMPWYRSLALIQVLPDANDLRFIWSAGVSSHTFHGQDLLDVARESVQQGVAVSRDTVVGSGGQARRAIIEAIPIGRSGRVLAMLQPKIA